MKIFLLLLFFPLVCFSQQTNHQVSVDKAIVIHLNEESGNVAYDNGNGADWTYTGTTKVDKCIIGSCRDFNRTSDQITRTGTLNNLAEFSFSVWFRYLGDGSNSGFYGILSNGISSGDASWGIRVIHSNMQLQFYVYQISGGYQGIVISNLVEVGKWHHAVGTFNLSSNYHRLYLDGKLIGSRTSISAINATKGTTLYIGQWHHPSLTMLWDGQIDEVVIYEGKELSQAEVSYLYAHQIGGYQ